MATVLSRKPGASGGGGAPSGPAGGDLGGTYPNPTVTNLIPKTLLDAKGDLIAASAADTAAKLTVGSNDMVLRADSGTATGLEWAYPPGYELDYAEITGDVTVSATVEATPDNVVALPARVYNGTTAVMLEFFTSRVEVGSGAGTFVIINLWDGASDLGRWAQLRNVAASTLEIPVCLRRRITPTAASHTYSAKAWRITANGTIEASTAMPAFIRSTVVTA